MSTYTALHMFAQVLFLAGNHGNHKNPCLISIWMKQKNIVSFPLKPVSSYGVAWMEPRSTDAQWSLFSSKYQFFGLGQTIWADKCWGIWGTFGLFISNHFGTVSPLSMFCINQPLFLQKLSLYIQIPNIHLGLGFEFGLQRIGDLAIVCP